MANPTLTPKRLNAVASELDPGWALPASEAEAATTLGAGPAGTGITGTRTFSAERAFGKAFILWAIIVATAAVGWTQVTESVIGVSVIDGTQVSEFEAPGWTIIAALVALGLAMVTIFKPKAAPITAPLYAVAEGLFLGVISRLFEIRWDGIVLQAVLATAATFLVCLALYVTGVVKVTRKFTFVVVAATLGIFVMYMATMVMSLFGADLAFWNEPSPLGIGLSVVICIVAALNLFLDFELIRQLNVAGAPKQMEWYAGFGLTITMVWLYFEILRLLSLLRQ